ncbi:MAG: hypothetical protein AB1439_09000 [candidate division FCPU426 bacterium]
MELKSLPLLLVLPDGGTRWPEAFPEERQAALQPFLSRAGAALDRAAALDHRTPFIVRGAVVPLLLKLDAPPGQSLPGRGPDRLPLFAFERRAVQACRRELQQAYRSFHDQVGRSAASRKVRAVLEVRALPDPAAGLERRPVLVSVGNNGSPTGEARPGAGRLTGPVEQARNLRDLLAARFSDVAGRVGLNEPQTGAYLGTRHGRPGVPWLTLGLAPGLLLDAEGRISEAKVQNVQERLETAFLLWCKLESWIGESPS